MEDEPEKKKPIPVILKDRKIFLNNMNSWLSKFIIDKLRTDTVKDPPQKNFFMGTINPKLTPELPYLFYPDLIKIDRTAPYEGKLFSNDLFIYDLNDQDFYEIEYIIKGLKTLKHEEKKYLIIISNILSWERTPPKYKKEKTEEEIQNEQNDPNFVPEEEEEPEPEDPSANDPGNENAEPKKPKLSYNDKDYVYRVPGKNFYTFKMIETLAYSASCTNKMLKTYIVCPGFLYGNGENIFYDYFKMAWLSNQIDHTLPILEDGKNLIPTIHINDFVSLIKRIIEKTPEAVYIIAVDKTKDRSLKNIITSISKSVGNSKVQHHHSNLTSIPNSHKMSIDLKMRSTKLFEDKQEEGEEEEDFNKRKFKWHCEFGIPENGEKLRNEFTEYQKLKPLKIAITGPPASGKTFLSEKLSEFYNIPHIKVIDLVNDAKKLTLNEEDALGKEIKDKMDEQIEKIFEQQEKDYTKLKNKNGIGAPDKTKIFPRVNDEFIQKILKSKLKENIYRNRGYILDGYPRNYKDAREIFMDKKEGEEITEEDKNPEEKMIMNKEIIPNSVILLEGCSDEELFSRIKDLPEEKTKGTHFNEEGMKRRLNSYRKINESNQQSLIKFFQKYSIPNMNINCKSNENELLNKLKLFLEREGPINNYMKFSEEYELKHKLSFESNLEKKNANYLIDLTENEFFDNHKSDEKTKFNKNKIEELKDRESKILEEKSQILRQYISENVVPILTQGILEVCQKLPNDPVDYLAEFLFEKSMQVPIKDPHKYNQ